MKKIKSLKNTITLLFALFLFSPILVADHIATTKENLILEEFFTQSNLLLRTTLKLCLDKKWKKATTHINAFEDKLTILNLPQFKSQNQIWEDYSANIIFHIEELKQQILKKRIHDVTYTIFTLFDHFEMLGSSIPQWFKTILIKT